MFTQSPVNKICYIKDPTSPPPADAASSRPTSNRRSPLPRDGTQTRLTPYTSLFPFDMPFGIASTKHIEQVSVNMYLNSLCTNTWLSSQVLCASIALELLEIYFIYGRRGRPSVEVCMLPRWRDSVIAKARAPSRFRCRRDATSL